MGNILINHVSVMVYRHLNSELSSNFTSQVYIVIKIFIQYSEISVLQITSYHILLNHNRYNSSLHKIITPK